MEEDSHLEGGENNREIEIAPALIAVHPTQDSVAVAVGSDLRVFDLRTDCGVSLVDDSVEPFHKDSVRAIRYSANGKLFVSAGDDKLVKIWSTDTWRCISSVSSEKRVSAVSISNDGLYVCFADKFGVVWVVDIHDLDVNGALSNRKAAPLLAHYCSIITRLEFSPDGCFIVSADRDFKIRVSVFPKKPLEGAHEIQSFCLGHTQFVSSLAFICSKDLPQGFLLSGSGDSTVRLWDITSGSLLDTCEVGSQAALSESDGSGESCCAVTDLCAIQDSNFVAVAIQGLQEIILLGCDFSSKTLSVAKVVSITEENFIPTSMGSSSAGELLWFVTGISKLRDADHKSLARLKVVSGLRKKGHPESPDQHKPVVLGDEEIPGSQKLLEKLQGSLSIDQSVFSAAAEAIKTAMCNLLIKKQYPTESREWRKRTRNDRKAKQ
ncbi:unnamed protein product [Linum tenue]|uniref:tRNA (guanine-N(7)-)-methyltransferase non-catalytic subunit n=1 Tax=Linum tenue TaxID=586396 RepID=A0AAV0ITF5_9ROSI|nr:unnamed protein product [Linum tenue]